MYQLSIFENECTGAGRVVQVVQYLSSKQAWSPEFNPLSTAYVYVKYIYKMNALDQLINGPLWENNETVD
jgi:hypothetical protein